MSERFLRWRQDKALKTEQTRQVSMEIAENLLQAVNDSARHVRNFYITFLLLALYISVIVWSTTDEMLLRISPVTLPLLNLKLPIKGFYAFAPYLFLMTHFNLLMQLNLLASMLHRLNQQLEGLPRENRESMQTRLFPFPFVHWISADHHGWLTRSLLVTLVWVLIIMLPPAVLVLLQLGFLPFHDPDILFWQRAAVGIDLALLWFFWPIIQSPDGCLRTWFSQASEILWLFRWWRGRRFSCDWPMGEGLVMTSLTAVLLVFSWGLSTLPEEVNQRFWADWLPTAWWVHKKDREDDLGWTVRLFDTEESPFHRNLRLHEKLLIANKITPAEEQKLRNSDNLKEIEAVLANIRGLDLRGRDLRYADFSKSLLPKVDMREADLQGAILGATSLQGAVLSGTNLQNAILHRANLQGADLKWAYLQDAQLGKTKLQDTDFKNAHLQDAYIVMANLQGANLSDANLQRADLAKTNLQGTDLRWAKLQGADLKLADLQGINLWNAHLDGINLKEKDLRGVNLGFAYLLGADLSNADLRGATLRGAHLQGAKLKEADLRGVDLEKANLQGADLKMANLSLAQLKDVKFGPFYQEIYEAIEKKLKDETDIKLQSQTLKVLQTRIGYFTSFENSTGENIYVRDGVLKGFLLSNGLHVANDSQKYQSLQKAFLVDLACQDVRVAKGIFNHRGIFFSCHFLQGFSSALLAHRNAGNCLGLENLDDGFIKKIRQTVNKPCD
jgi:uncharacterized protein YjbI with pentapeptide repeats